MFLFFCHLKIGITKDESSEFIPKDEELENNLTNEEEDIETHSESESELESESESELESESESKYDSELDDELGMRIENELRIHLAKDLPRAGKFINPKVLLKIVKNNFSCKNRHRQGWK